jgi:ankyrin repeat protein
MTGATIVRGDDIRCGQVSATTSTENESIGANPRSTIVFMLSVEDNCLGIDFKTGRHAIEQVWRGQSTDCLSDWLEASLRGISKAQKERVIENPISLVMLYTTQFIQIAACHLELCRREWTELYERYANTSAVYGNEDNRKQVRKIVKDHSRRLQYLQVSRKRIKCFSDEAESVLDSDDDNQLSVLQEDFGNLATEMESLKSAYDTFLEQQVNKISLYESRLSANEARNLNRLSYLAFVFAPLSLASSFFSTSIKPLGGKTPVWIFAITCLATLIFAFFVLGLSSIRRVREWVSGASIFLAGVTVWCFECCSCMISGGSHGIEQSELPRTEPEKRLYSSTTRIQSTFPQLNHSFPLNHEIADSSSPKGSKSYDSTVSVLAPYSSSKVTTMESTSQASSTTHSFSSKDTGLQKRLKPRIPINDSTRRKLEYVSDKVTSAANPQLREVYFDQVPRPDSSTFQYLAQHRPTTRQASSTKVVIVEERRMPTIAETSAQPESSEASSSSGKTGSYTSEDAAEDRDPTTDPDSQIPYGLRPGNMIYKHNRTALHQAAYDGDMHLVRLLLGKGPGAIDQKDKKGRTPLCLAAKKGHLPIVKYLIEIGAIPYRRNEWGPSRKQTNAFTLAAINRQEEVMVVLLEWYKQDLKRSSNMPRDESEDEKMELMVGDTLAEACGRKDIATVEAVIKACKAQGDWYDYDYERGLYFAASNGLLDAIPLLANAMVYEGSAQRELSRLLTRAVEDASNASTLVKKLLEEGASTDIRNPLVLACNHGLESMVLLLLESGADPNLNYERLPLAVAAEQGSIPLLEILLNAKADVNGIDVVQSAARGGDVGTMRFLIDSGANIHVEQSPQYESRGYISEPLQCAAAKGYDAMVRFLLETGIIPSTPSPYSKPYSKGEAAFVDACSYNHESTALLLVDAGVDIHIKDGGGRNSDTTPNHSESIATIAMLHAAKHGMPKLMKHALDAGASANAYDPNVDYWQSLLDIAVESGNAETVTLLLEYGADIQDGGVSQTPLHTAIENKKLDVTQLLLERGADVESTASDEKETPLHVAAGKDMVAFATLLLSHNAEIESVDKDGQTPLHKAAREGYVAMVNMLLEKGAKIDARDREEWTPVHRAAWNRHADVVELLKRKGADMQATTDSGLTVEDFLDSDAGADTASVKAAGQMGADDHALIGTSTSSSPHSREYSPQSNVIEVHPRGERVLHPKTRRR